MAADMRRSTPLLLALLAACQTSPADPDDTAVAHATSSSEMAKMLQDKNHTPKTSDASDQQAPATQANKSADSVGTALATPVAIDSAQRREYAEVTVNLQDPNGQKVLVSYLMKPEEWHIEKVTQTTPTTKRWRFWRVARSDGKSMPEIDPLKPRTTPPPPFKSPAKK